MTLPVPSVSPDYRDLSDWVVMRILEAIKGGQIKPGERLVERDVAAQLSVSRAPVRDAFYKLENLGVLVRKQPRANYVRSWTNREVAEVLFILDALILLSVQLATDRLSADHLAELEQNIEQTRAAVAAGSKNVWEQVGLDLAFHLTIARASGNSLLVEQIEALWRPMQICMADYLARFGREFSLRQHQELLEVLKQGDAQRAEEMTRSHQRESQAAILKALQADPVEEPGDPEPASLIPAAVHAD
jgi:DNA-binding GntR family transcriptional regulator